MALGRGAYFRNFTLPQNQVRHRLYTPYREPFMRMYWAHFLEKWEIRVRDSCARKRVQYRV